MMASMSDALVRQLLDGRYIASLATTFPSGKIHMVAVWYLFDGANIYVATSSQTRKARNLKVGSSVSIMIDSRDPLASFGVTIVGTAQILTGDISHEKNHAIHRRYLSEAALADPVVGPVFAGWEDVTIQITPASVIAWDMRELDRQALGGAFARNPSFFLPLEH
jgi:general stress protein 26